MTAVFALLFLVAASVMAAPTGPITLSGAFHQSAGLSRKLLQDVGTLIVEYKQVKIGNPSFEDYSLLLRSLPSSRMGYGQWVDMQDEERLQLNCKDLQVFWMHVDYKHVHELSQNQPSVLVDSMERISLDLRDLISQLNGQLSALNSTSPDPPDLTLPHTVLNPAYEWHSKLQGYIIFRDLETYLNKVVHDFTLLKTKYRE